MIKRKNHRIIVVCLLFVAFLGAFNTVRSEDSFFFSSLGVEDGLSQVSVLNIFQDSDGYLWFGTRNGVNRYNGYEFTIYRNKVNDSTSLSDNYIQAINEDRNKNIWVATSNGINCIDYQTHEITRFYTEKQKGSNNSICRFLKHANGSLFLFSGSALFRCDPDKQLRSVALAKKIRSTVYSVFQDEDGDVYVGTGSDGLYVYSKNWKLKHHLSTDASGKNKGVSPLGIISTLQGGLNGQMWIGTNDQGICLLDKKTQQISCMNRSNSGLLNNSIRALVRLNTDSLLIGTFGGLNVLNLKTRLITPLKMQNGGKGALSHYSVHSLFVDKDQTLWVGTYSAGINYHSLYYNPIFMITPHQFTGIIGKGQEDASGILWFATEGAGLFKYDPRTGSQKLYPLVAPHQGNYESNIIKSILVRGDSIFCTTHFGSVYLFSIRKEQYKKIFDTGINDIYSLCLDSRGRLWIPTHSSQQLVRMDGARMENRFPVQNGTRSFENITLVEEIRPGLFVFGSLQDSIYLYDEAKAQVTNLRNRVYLKGPHDRLGSITSILYDPIQAQLWISSSRGGVMRFDRHFKLMKHYQKENGLSESYISSMTRDKENRIWAVTGRVLYRLNQMEDLFYPVKLYGVPTQEFTLYGGSCLSSDGNIYFPGNKGIVSFFPGAQNQNPILPKVHITSVIVSNFNKKDPANEQNAFYPRQDSNQLVLKAHQNNLTIRFVALNYLSSSLNQYSFQLEGVDPGWHMSGHRREAYYNNLAPGKYVFRVKASNNDGIWNPQEAVLYITITPPFYKSWWAYLLYTVLAVGFTLWMVKILQHKQEQKRERRYKQMEQDKLNELHEERMRMFTNFSHELRTPLTLIMNPLEDLLGRVPFSPEVKDRLSMIKKNTGKMLLLVNNLLDIQKYEAGKLSLTKTSFEFTSFINEVFHNFESLAHKREIGFQLLSNLTEPFQVYFDKTEIEKVFFNLLSNAFKFTPSNGTISIRLDVLDKEQCIALPLIPKDRLEVLTEARYLKVEVSDTGSGVPEKDVEKVFEPFFRDQQDMHHQIAGTGIGLTLSKSIVTLHGGIIWLDSSKKPGAHFILLLPDSLSSEEKTEELFLQPIERRDVNKKVLSLVKETESKKKQTLLLVDDNREILHYLESQLLEDYNVEKAGNGKEALARMETHSVDLVLSDVMMPEMNGLEFCKRIKVNPGMCHIPVVLLTAKSMVPQIEEGLEAGADDYIVKPFQISLLKARIRNILSLREKIKEQTQETFSLKRLGITLNDEDTDFLSRYIEIVKLNIINPELDVAVIYQGLGMSRANFYRKVKTVTGLSPIDLIRNIRLDIGARLLKESDLNVSEIAQQIGFSSRSYFARSFKAVYGVSPSEYQELK